MWVHFSERCGISFPIALADMHQCEREKCVKRFRGINVNQHVANHCFGDQPVSPFRLFMYFLALNFVFVF